MWGATGSYNTHTWARAWRDFNARPGTPAKTFWSGDPARLDGIAQPVGSVSTRHGTALLSGKLVGGPDRNRDFTERNQEIEEKYHRPLLKRQILKFMTMRKL